MPDKRVAFITGAGTGIGRGIARAFARNDYDVLVCDIDAQLAAETVAMIAADGNAATPVVGDIGTPEGAANAVKAGIAVHGRIEVIICNAAVFLFNGIDDLTDEQIERTFSINLKSIFWIIRASLKTLEEAEFPRILITSSCGGNRSVTPGLLAYETSKSAIGGLIRNLAVDLGPRGITINAIEPGFIMTERTSNRYSQAGIDKIARRIPLQRLGSADDIANAMLFLASAQASYITGQSLAVSGGVELLDGLGTSEHRTV
jgi:3-oxoacyl-[acyl-carrier protein] reductase